MPVPVIAGFGWFASLLGGLFGSLIAFFAKYVTRKIAIIGAVIAVIVTLTTGFFVAVDALIATIDTSVPTEYSGFIGHVMPANTSVCISVYLGVRAARWLYEWNVKIVQMKVV